MSHLFLLVGLPGAGKTTRARELEQQHRALRLSPDDWMMPLFGVPDVDHKRDVMEGRLVSIGLRALQLGVDVVLDFGFWGTDERSSLRALARDHGASSSVIYLDVDEATQLTRLDHRLRENPDSFVAVTLDELAEWRGIIQIPSEAELAGTLDDPPPPGSASWADYATTRWPSLVLPPGLQGVPDNV